MARTPVFKDNIARLFDEAASTELTPGIVSLIESKATRAQIRDIPIGKILALVILYEIHDITRFPRVQDFVSYCRLVKCAKLSDGKHYGYSGKKIGNAHLKWAFSEASVLFLRKNALGQHYLATLTKKHGKAKALSILAAKLGRAVYFMMQKERVFEMERFSAKAS